MEPSISDLLIVGLFVISFALGLRFPGAIGSAALLMGFVLLGATIASGMAPDPNLSVRPLLTRAYLIVAWWLLIAALIVDNPRDNARVIFNAYVAAAVLAALLGTLVSFELIQDFGQLTIHGRVRALFKDPNVYGPFLVPALIYCIYRLQQVRGLSGIFYLAALGLLVLGLILGFSRGSWLNCVVSIGVFVAFRYRSNRSLTNRVRIAGLVLALGAVGAVAVGTALSVNDIGETLSARATVIQEYDVNTELGGNKSRFQAQAETFALAMKHPLGIGAGQSESEQYQGMAPHNLFLHVLVESGWIGGLAFYIFIGLTFFRCSRFILRPSPTRGYCQVALASLSGILVQSAFIDSTHWRHFYLLLGMVWGFTLVAQTARREATWGPADAHPALTQ